MTDADAVIKCFATAFSTAILLYLAPFLFDVKFSLLVVPGTLVVFMATWLYVETAPVRSSAANAHSPFDPAEKSPPPCQLELLVSIITRPRSGPVGLLLSSLVLASTIAAINTWDIESYQKLHDEGSVAAPTMDSYIQQSGLGSPFANTVGFVRWNAAYLERIPLIQKYEPFFHTVHYSIPNYIPDPPTEGKFVNVTHSSWDNHENVYIPVADVMSLILDDPVYSSIEGLLFFHFDLWINPLEFNFMDYNRIWSTGHSCYDNKDGGRGWHWWDARPLWEQGTDAIAALNGTHYATNKVEVCSSWTDVYYVPRKYFTDFIYLAHLMDPMFHESAIPTMFNIIDRTYRHQDAGKEYVRLGDCWGGCCASNPTPEDIMWSRCGHRLNYLDPITTALHYDRLDRQATSLSKTVFSLAETDNENDRAEG